MMSYVLYIAKKAEHGPCCRYNNMSVVKITKYIPNCSQRRLCKVVIAIYLAAKALNALYTTNKMECFSFKSWCVIYTSGETFKSRLACNVVVLIAAYC